VLCFGLQSVSGHLHSLASNQLAPSFVGAVAIATLPQDHEANNELWAAIDSGSWVTPQLAAVAFLRDPMFADHAWERLRSGCRVNTFRSAGVSAVERHISGCPGGSVKRSAKTAASLVRLVGLLPQQPAGLIAQASTPDLVSLVSKDIDSSGSIAEGWLKILKKNLVDLGVATGGDEAF